MPMLVIPSLYGVYRVVSRHGQSAESKARTRGDRVTVRRKRTERTDYRVDGLGSGQARAAQLTF